MSRDTVPSQIELSRAPNGSLLLFRKHQVIESHRGGMGWVHLAYSAEWQRILAFKTMIKSLSSSPRWQQRFRSESQVLLGLPRHPNLVPFHYFDIWNGVPFVAMEAVFGPTGRLGETLANRVRSRRVPTARVLRWAIEICDGLNAAFERLSILHLDLKPSNVLVDIAGAARVSDFGLAMRAKMAESSDFRVLGTPGYRSPEHYELRNLSPRADIFSIGCILFELLYGTSLFSPEIQMKSFFEVESTRRSPPAPTGKVLEPLARLVERCAATDRDKRPASYRDLSSELKNHFRRCTGTHFAPRVSRGDETSFEVRLNRAVSWGNIGNYDRARKELSDLLEEGRYESVVHYNLGNLLVEEGKHSGAVEHFEKSLKHEPGNAAALGNLAYALQLGGRTLEAKDAVAKCLELEPRNKVALVNKGFILGSEDNHDGALECFENVLRLDPKDPDALAASAIALANLGRVPEARERLAAAKSLAPLSEKVIFAKRQIDGSGEE